MIVSAKKYYNIVTCDIFIKYILYNFIFHKLFQLSGKKFRAFVALD